MVRAPHERGRAGRDPVPGVRRVAAGGPAPEAIQGAQGHS